MTPDLSQIRADLEPLRERWPDGCLMIRTQYGLLFHLCDLALRPEQVEQMKRAMQIQAEKMMRGDYGLA